MPESKRERRNRLARERRARKKKALEQWNKLPAFEDYHHEMLTMSGREQATFGGGCPKKADGTVATHLLMPGELVACINGDAIGVVAETEGPEAPITVRWIMRREDAEVQPARQMSHSLGQLLRSWIVPEALEKVPALLETCGSAPS